MKIQIRLTQLCFVIPALFLAVGSHAKPVAGASSKAPKMLAAGTPPAREPEITAEDFDKALQEADARGNRTIAVADRISDQALTDSFKTLRSRFIGGQAYENGKETATTLPGVKTTAELHAFLTDLGKEEFYNKLSPDAQFLAAQMAPLAVFHGFFNRAMDLLENTPITHMAAVLGLRTFASSVMVYFPTDQWEVGMKYVTVPSSDMGSLIQNEDDLHNFMEKELIPAIIVMKDRLSKLSFKDKPIYFDNRFFYGTASFFSDRDQYFRIGEPERLTVLANAFYILSGLESLNAYNTNGAFNAMDRISQNFGFNSSVRFKPEQTSARQRFDILKELGQSSKLFRLRDNGKGWMLAAYDSLVWAVKCNTVAFKELKKSQTDKDSNLNFMDPRTFMSNFPRMGAGLNNMRYIVMGTGKEGRVQSAIVGTEGKLVSLRDFYYNPPSSLVNLMPTGFDTSPYSPTSKIMYNGKPRPWHNFLSGRPVAWSISDYQTIFPEVRTNQDIADTARIMAQAWGGWIIGIPMSALVL